MKTIKKSILIFLLLVSISTLYVRFNRSLDFMFLKSSQSYDQFKSELNYKEFYIDLEKGIKIHSVLFKPSNTTKPKGTIIHYHGGGQHLMYSQEKFKPILDNGYQIVSYERRGFAKSTGGVENSEVYKNDVIKIFDILIAMTELKEQPIILWGQSMGGPFAIVTAKEREAKIKGVILEGTFNSFVDIGKFYTTKSSLLKIIRPLIPVLVQDNISIDNNIDDVKYIPIYIFHSKNDKIIPYQFGKDIYDNHSEKAKKFITLDTNHLNGVDESTTEYLEIIETIFAN